MWVSKSPRRPRRRRIHCFPGTAPVAYRDLIGDFGWDASSYQLLPMADRPAWGAVRRAVRVNRVVLTWASLVTRALGCFGQVFETVILATTQSLGCRLMGRGACLSACSGSTPTSLVFCIHVACLRSCAPYGSRYQTPLRLREYRYEWAAHVRIYFRAGHRRLVCASIAEPSEIAFQARVGTPRIRDLSAARDANHSWLEGWCNFALVCFYTCLRATHNGRPSVFEHVYFARSRHRSGCAVAGRRHDASCPGRIVRLVCGGAAAVSEAGEQHPCFQMSTPLQRHEPRHQAFIPTCALRMGKTIYMHVSACVHERLAVLWSPAFHLGALGTRRSERPRFSRCRLGPQPPSSARFRSLRGRRSATSTSQMHRSGCGHAVASVGTRSWPSCIGRRPHLGRRRATWLRPHTHTHTHEGSPPPRLSGW